MIIVMTREDIIRILAEVLPELREQYKVRTLGLFGSYARGDQTEHSDIDLLVDVEPSIGLDFVDLAERIETLLGHHVDLVSTRAIKKRYRQVIEQDLIHV